MGILPCSWEFNRYYDRAIKLEPKNPLAYFNKGNTYFNKNEKEKACEIWIIARDLGSKSAINRIEAECNKNRID